MRRISAQAPEDISRASNLCDEVRTYRFITPVFGGGVRVDGHHKPADPITPVRVASVRGQLRFWWRAVNPRRCANVEGLRRAEAEVFGTAAGGKVVSGALDISCVKQPSNPTEKPILRDGDKFKCLTGMDALAYGAFPLRDTAGERHGTLHEYAQEWSLRFRYGDSVADDLAAALWAWAHFGGLGGRTRRGFGAIRQTSSGLYTIHDGWQRWIVSPDNQVPWPHLACDMDYALAKNGKVCPSGSKAHEVLLDLMRLLRQGKIGRNPQSTRQGARPGRPGRSYWPEPDVLRAAYEGCAGLHWDNPATEVDKVPRALFGLPIITSFKPENGEIEPNTSTMVPRISGKVMTRWASPLVLRPVMIASGYIPCALRLRQAMPSAIVLQENLDVMSKSFELSEDERKLLRPFKNSRTSTDVIDLYLNLLRAPAP